MNTSHMLSCPKLFRLYYLCKRARISFSDCGPLQELDPVRPRIEEVCFAFPGFTVYFSSKTDASPLVIDLSVVNRVKDRIRIPSLFHKLPVRKPGGVVISEPMFFYPTSLPQNWQSSSGIHPPLMPKHQFPLPRGKRSSPKSPPISIVDFSYDSYISRRSKTQRNVSTTSEGNQTQK